MRKIKFRAWDKKAKEFVYYENYLPPRYKIVCQFTGLLDKNGKEIYEGDIVLTEFGNFEVYWRQKYGGWYIRKSDGHIEFLAPNLGNPHTLEVIGNIYETPELLTSNQ
jgi:uncharacterized phage protein (TIGR01671 family)